MLRVEPDSQAVLEPLQSTFLALAREVDGAREPRSPVVVGVDYDALDFLDAFVWRHLAGRWVVAVEALDLHRPFSVFGFSHLDVGFGDEDEVSALVSRAWWRCFVCSARPSSIVRYRFTVGKCV